MSLFLSLLLLLIAVAFFTLLERNVLGSIMLRVGPNKPSLAGLLVPFSDAINLLSKPFLLPLSSSRLLMLGSCFIFFLVPALLWAFSVKASFVSFFPHSALVILVLISFSVFGLLAAGWGSNSKYSNLGSTRCIAQSISYEVILTLLILCFVLVRSFSITSLVSDWGWSTVFHLCLILFIVVLAETNRSPFDFAEGESELVSGYNVEFSGPGFVVLFLSEYLSILFICSLVGTLSASGSYFASFILGGFFGFLFIWVRGTLPRYRYDQLISLAWKSLLPIVLSSLIVLLLYYYYYYCFES